MACFGRRTHRRTKLAVDELGELVEAGADELDVVNLFLLGLACVRGGIPLHRQEKREFRDAVKGTSVKPKVGLEILKIAAPVGAAG